ncbi:MAG: tryptophan synthase subunit alpha, partial [Thermomicrobiales bacterium]
DRTAVIPFVTAGYPTRERSLDWLLALVRGGADIIELGVPFSDPLADGATVQRTSQTALRQGVTLADAVAMARRAREEHGVAVPILLMGYVNPMMQYGFERLAADCAAAGVDGFIVPDLPAEESDELLAVCRQHGLDLIFLLAPTSTDERIVAVAQRASGFIYCVSLTGVTGQRDILPDFSPYLQRVRAQTDLPLAIGFGISTPEHVQRAGAAADGAVVASAMINFLDTVPEEHQTVAAEQFVRGLRGEAPFPPHMTSMPAAVAEKPAAPDTDGIVVPDETTAESTLNRPGACRGIRGATTIETNTAEDILEATTDLLDAMIRLNAIAPDDVVSAIFTTTPEITAAFPALAARDLGWTEVPLLCGHEMDVPGALRGVVRILLHVNTLRTPAEIRHVYLREARALRPEWAYDDGQLSDILGRAVTATDSTA